MTFEELKAEAKRQGYNLIKQPTYIPLKPCVCGAKRSVKTMYSFNKKGHGYYCYKCKRASDYGDTTRDARTNWNNMIESEVQNG